MNIVKQINLGYAFLLLFLLIFSETIAQTTLLIQPSAIAGKDAYVSGLAGQDNMNFGTDPELKATSYGGKQIYLYFNFSQIPSTATVLSAKIKLYAAGTGHVVAAPNFISLFSVLQPWAEDLITYNNQPALGNFADAVVPSPDSAMQNYSIDIRSKVQSFVTGQTTGFGFLLKLNYLGSLNFASSDNADPNKRPALEVVYGVCTSTPPPAMISPSPSTTICKGDLVTYVANAGAGYYYEWFRNGISKAYGSSNTYTTSQSGNYVVAVTEPSGCKTLSSVSTLYVTLENAKVTHHNNSTNPACVNGGVQLNATGGVGFTYHWYKDGIPINDFDSVHVTSDTGFYSCSISSGNCVIMSNAIDARVFRAEVKKYGPERICIGPSEISVKLINFNYYSNNFQWENSGSAISGATSSQYDVVSSGNYRCKITTTECTSPVYTNYQSMSVGVQPNLVLYSNPGGTADPISLCPGDNGQLYLQHADGFYFYPDSTTNFTWFYDYPSEYLGNYSYIDVNGTYDKTGLYNAFVTTGCGYSDLYKGINITGQGKPDLQIISNSLCDSVRLEVPYKSYPYNYRKWKAYQWLHNGISLSADTMYYIYAKQSGSYACLLTNDCDTVTTNPVQAIVLNDYAIIYSDDTTICSGQSRLLWANNNPGISYHKWYKDGILISAGAYCYATQAGTYYCEIGGTCGTFISNSITLTVIPSPTSNVTVSDPPYCIQGPVLLSTDVQSNVSYQWIKNNVSIQGANQPTFSADVNGYYQVSVTLYNGCVEKSDTLRIIVDSLKPVITSSLAMPVCKGYGFILNLNITGSYYAIQWYKNNLPLPNSNNNYLYVSGEDENYYATVTSICGTFASDIFHVSVLSSPSILTAIGDTVFCGNDSVLLQANNVNATLFRWYNNNSIYATTNLPQFYAKYSGVYYVFYNDSLTGCNANTNKVTVSSSGGISYIMTCGTPEWSGCGSLALAVNAASGDSIIWKKNNVVIPGATSSSYNAVSSGNYEAVISNSCGSFRSNVEKVRIDTSVVSPSLIYLFTSGGPPCVGNSLSIYAYQWSLPGNGSDLDSFQWRFNGSVIPGATISDYYPTQSGLYSLDVINACGVSASTGVTITIQPKPDPLISASGPTTFCG